MELKEIVDMMRANGVKRLQLAGIWRDGDGKLTSWTPGEIELFESAPRVSAAEPAPAFTVEDVLEAIEPKLEVKESGVCCVRGCSGESGGAMAGRIAPEMCRDHALQLGGMRT